MKNKLVKSTLAIVTAILGMSSEAQMPQRPDPAQMEAAFQKCESSTLNEKGIKFSFKPGQRPTGRPSQDEMDLMRACTDAGILQSPPRPPRGGGPGQLRGGPPPEFRPPQNDNGGGTDAGQ